MTWTEFESREPELKQKRQLARWLAISVLRYSAAMRVLREVRHLYRNVAPVQELVLLDKLISKLWETAQNSGAEFKERIRSEALEKGLISP